MDDDVLGFLWLPIGTFVVFARQQEEEEKTLASAEELQGELQGFDLKGLEGITPLEQQVETHLDQLLAKAYLSSMSVVSFTQMLFGSI